MALVRRLAAVVPAHELGELIADRQLSAAVRARLLAAAFERGSRLCDCIGSNRGQGASRRATGADAGKDARVFPNEPFDGWRGAPQDIHSRLVEIVDYATDGPAAWYRDIARHVLSGACQHPDGPPTSSGELLERMDLTGLRAAHGAAWTRGLREDLVSQTRLRYQSFFTQTRGALDGAWGGRTPRRRTSSWTPWRSGTRRVALRGSCSRTSRSTSRSASRAGGCA